MPPKKAETEKQEEHPKSPREKTDAEAELTATRRTATAAAFSIFAWLLAYPAFFLWSLFYVILILPSCEYASTAQQIIFYTVYAVLGFAFATCALLLTKPLGHRATVVFIIATLFPYLAIIVWQLNAISPLRGFCL